MIHDLPYRRMLIITEGSLGIFSAKTCVCLLRYRGGDVVGLLDSEHAGRLSGELLADVPSVPIFGSPAEACETQPDAVVIGIAPVGGALPPAMRKHVADALRQGLAVISGLHMHLADDEEFRALASASGARIHDVREAGQVTRIATGKARDWPVKRVLTVGTSTNVGKMLTAMELRRAAERDGLDAAFVATGQTGIMIEGWGIAVDHVLSDFTAGAAEMMVERVADKQVCFVEGQGSLDHPAYSGVTLSLLHGCCPDAMVMVHCPGRELHNELAGCPIAPLVEQIELYERILAPLHPGKMAAVAVNTVGMSDPEADRAIAEVRAETGLPAADVVRQGPEPIWQAVRAILGL